jgi:hypothetical protein
MTMDGLMGPGGAALSMRPDFDAKGQATPCFLPSNYPPRLRVHHEKSARDPQARPDLQADHDLLGLLAVLALSAANAQTTNLLNASYDVAREFYKDYNTAFVANYKKTTGKDIKMDQSHAGSSAQGAWCLTAWTPMW